MSPSNPSIPPHILLTNILSRFLAREELAIINADCWGDDVWGSAGEPAPTPLRFLFGKDDEWIPSEERDQLIQLRGRRNSDTVDKWRAVMEVDDTGAAHDFAAKSSGPVAVKVAGWVKEMIGKKRGV